MAPKLVRAIGRWALTALVLNSIIGSGIFGLPSTIWQLLGRWSIAAYIIAALGIGAIMACFAEVASQFSEAGGPYLYARETFGRYAGIQVGWLAWLVRLTSAAANANVFILYLGEFWKPAGNPLPRVIVLGVLLGGLAIVNCRGVGSGANLSSFFAVAKLAPLLLLIVVALVMASNSDFPIHPVTPPAQLHWMEAILLLVFAFGGFEGGLMSQGEVRDPRRDVPFALMAALIVTTVFYVLLQGTVQAALSSNIAVATSVRPIAEAARVFLGGPGAAIVSLGALVSVYGYLASQMLNAPRLTFALAEGRDFPPFFAKIHPRFHTPYVSIIVYAVLVWALASTASFRWNATLSAIGRLFTYAAVCGALPWLRATQPDRPAFRLPAGLVATGIGLMFCVVMITRMGRSECIAIAATVALAIINWRWTLRDSAEQR